MFLAQVEDSLGRFGRIVRGLGDTANEEFEPAFPRAGLARGLQPVVVLQAILLEIVREIEQRPLEQASPRLRQVASLRSPSSLTALWSAGVYRPPIDSGPASLSGVSVVAAGEDWALARSSRTARSGSGRWHVWPGRRWPACPASRRSLRKVRALASSRMEQSSPGDMTQRWRG